VNRQPIPSDVCSDCGTALEHGHEDGERCPECFERYLYDIDAGFLENYRKFGARSRLVVAETCLRGLVVAAPEHRKVLAMTIFEQYVSAMNDLAALVSALRHRQEAPVLQSFLAFKLDQASAGAFFDAVQSVNDVELLTALELPLPGQVASLCPHLNAQDAYSVAVAIYQLVQDLRKATDKGNAGAAALAQFAGQSGGALIADDARWLNGSASHLTPDQVALLVLDSRRRSIYVQGLTADESAMGQVVDAIDTATRAASNLIYAYLEISDK
jgi:hypothetical protein